MCMCRVANATRALIDQVCLAMFDLLAFSGEDLRQGRSNMQVWRDVACAYVSVPV